MAKSLFNKVNEYRNSGFGTKTDHEPDRLLNQDGSLNVKKTGMNFFDHFSIFHFLVTANWFTFNIIVIGSYILINVFFGFIYWQLGIEEIGIKHDTALEDFLESVYFSAQTFSTVGYGRANPGSHWANLVAFSEMLIGMMYLALAAGLLFARFSRPVAKIIFSKKALVAPYRGGKGFMFRLTNAKTNLLLEVSIKVLLMMHESVNNQKVRRFYDLTLELNKINMLPLSWTVVHPIDENSPLTDMNKEDLKSSKAEFIVLLKGYNNTLSQQVHARTSYKPENIEWDARFSNIFSYEHGKTIIKVDKVGQYDNAKTS
jgi:inward rectifier potassium channel